MEARNRLKIDFNDESGGKEPTNGAKKNLGADFRSYKLSTPAKPSGDFKFGQHLSRGQADNNDAGFQKGDDRNSSKTSKKQRFYERLLGYTLIVIGAMILVSGPLVELGLFKNNILVQYSYDAGCFLLITFLFFPISHFALKLFMTN